MKNQSQKGHSKRVDSGGVARLSPTVFGILLFIACFVHVLVVGSLGLERSRLDAHTEFYILEALSSLLEGRFEVTGPRVGPLPVHAGPVPYGPYWMALLVWPSLGAIQLFKMICSGASVLLIGILLRRSIPEHRWLLVIIPVFGVALSVLLEAAALNLRYTSFLPVLVAGYLLSIQRFSERDGHVVWLWLATLLAGTLLLFHVLTATLLWLVPGVLWLRRKWCRKHLMKALLPLCVGLLLLGPFVIDVVTYLLTPSDAVQVGSTTSRGAGVLDRAWFLFHVLDSRLPSSLARFVGFSVANLTIAGCLISVFALVRGRLSGFAGLVTVQTLIAAAVFGFTGGYAMKESHLYAYAMPAFLTGAFGLNHMLSWISGFAWAKPCSETVSGAGILAVTFVWFVVLAQGLSSTQDKGYPPSISGVETRVTKMLERYPMASQVVHQRVHGFLRTGDAGISVATALAIHRAAADKSRVLGEREHVFVTYDGIDAAPYGSKDTASQEGFYAYQPAIDYGSGFSIRSAATSRCRVEIPFQRITLGKDLWAAQGIDSSDSARCIDESISNGEVRLAFKTIPMGQPGFINVLIDVGGRDVGLTARDAKTQMPLKVLNKPLPVRWPSRWFELSVPGGASAKEIEIVIQGASGLNLIDIF